MQPVPARNVQNQHTVGARNGGGFRVMPGHAAPRGKLQQMPVGEIDEQKTGAAVQRKVA